MSHSNHTYNGSSRGIGDVRVAIVTNNQDPEDLGRVQLKYPWRDEEDESYWARIAVSMAGDGYGTYFLPEVGDEVLIGFEYGDIHNPIVIGGLWSGKRKPPETNPDGTNDIRTITSRSGHRIDFDDTDDAGVVKIETTAGHTILLDDANGAESITIEDSSGNSIKMDGAKNSIDIEATQAIRLAAQTIDLSADSQVSIQSNGTVEMAGRAKTDVTSDGQMNLKSNGFLGINSSGPLTLRGAIIQLN